MIIHTEQQQSVCGFVLLLVLHQLLLDHLTFFFLFLCLGFSASPAEAPHRESRRRPNDGG